MNDVTNAEPSTTCIAYTTKAELQRPCAPSMGETPPATGHPLPLPRLAFSIEETAQMLGVCTKTVRRLIARGQLRSSRALRHHLISGREIARFLEETTA